MSRLHMKQDRLCFKANFYLWNESKGIKQSETQWQIHKAEKE